MSQGGILNYVASTPSIPTSFSTDAGTAIPVANLLQILGGEGIDTSAAGNIITITGELATAAANVGLANIGVCAFDSADFNVVNGFVTIATTFGGIQSILTDSGPPAILPNVTGQISILGGTGTIVIGTPLTNTVTINTIGNGLTWTREPLAAVPCVVNHGYINTNVGLTTFTLPINSIVGDVIAIGGEGAGGWTIAQNAGQNIQISNVSSTIGVGGSVSSTNQYDSICLVCRVANTTWHAYIAPIGVLKLI